MEANSDPEDSLQYSIGINKSPVSRAVLQNKVSL